MQSLSFTTQIEAEFDIRRNAARIRHIFAEAGPASEAVREVA